MGRIYAYNPSEVDCSTIGLVGALIPTEASFNIKAGEFGELTLTHPIDEWGKWQALQTNVILKAPVPVRLVPIFKEKVYDPDNPGEVDEYETIVYKYRVKNGLSKEDRTIYKGSKKDNKKAVKVLSGGKAVTVTKTDFASGRWKVTAKVGSKKYTGWMNENSLEETGEQPIVLTDPTVNSYEAINSSYAVKDQLFRIYDVQKSDDNGGTITVTAMRLAYDLNGVPTRYSNTGEVTGSEAIRGCLGEAFLLDTGFSAYSNVGTKHVGFDGRGKSLIEAICDPDAGIAGVFNGQLVSDDYEIYLLANAGMDRGYTIRYGKNLLGVTCEVDTTDMVEGILPYGENEDGSILYIDINTNIGTGYERREDGEGTLVPEIIYKFGVTTPTHRVVPLQVSDAKVNKKSGITAENARAAMVDAAHAEFENGCYSASITLDVDFIMLGDTEEYADYKHLESLFVYDTVRVHHKALDIDITTTLTELTWDCIAERVTGAHFGELKDISPTVSSYQLSGVNGTKIMQGTISGQQIGNGAIKGEHLQFDTIDVRSMHAESITAENAFVTRMSGEALNFTTADINTLTAGLIESHIIDAEQITGALAVFDILKGTYANLSEANIKTLISETLHTGQVQTDQIYAKYIEVAYLNAANAYLGRCVLKGDDGNWYEMRVGSDGTIFSALTTVTPEEEAEGKTDNGKTIIPDTSIREKLTEEGALENLPEVFDAISATTIDTDTLFAREATIGSMRSVNITSQREGAPLYLGNMMDDLRDGMLISRQEGTTVVDVGDLQGRNMARINKEGLQVIVGGQSYSKFASSYAQFGDYQLRKTVDGGLVFKRVTT